MKKNILRDLAIFLAILPQLSFSAEKTQQWWGAEIEGAPSMGFRVQQDTAFINIDDITGLGGEVICPVVRISCSSENEVIIASQQFLKIFANKLFINDTYYECLSLGGKEFSKADFLFSMNSRCVQNNQIQSLPQTTIRIDSDTDILAPLHDIFEIIIQNFRNNSFEEINVKSGFKTQYRWKFAQSFDAIINGKLMSSEKETIYTIVAASCYENIYSPPHYVGDDYSHGGWEFFIPTSMESFKQVFKKYLESYNNVKINSEYYDGKFQVGLSPDPKHENSSLNITKIMKMGKKSNYGVKYQLVLFIEPKEIKGLFSMDF